jgi:tetratricopeptide (TPR) repeat protein
MEIINAGDRFHRAQCIHQGVEGYERDLAKAEKIYCEILDHAPSNPWVLYALGTLHIELHHWGFGAFILSQVANIQDDIGELHNTLGIALRAMGDMDGADKAYARAGELLPGVADIPSNRAGLRINAGVPAQALEFANKALELDPDHVDAKSHKALALLELGAWNKAWDYHEARLEKKSNAYSEFTVRPRNYSGDPDSPTPMWDGESDGTLVIHGEQGIGDEIMFASCFEDVAKIVGWQGMLIEPQPRLQALFQRTFPDCRVVGTHNVDGSDWIEKETDRPQFRIPMGSLPKFFRRSKEAFPRRPYLKADPDLVDAATRRLPSDAPRVGISWQGGVHETHVELRSIPLPALRLILEQEVDWISLQYTAEAVREVAEFENTSGIRVHHYPELIEIGQDYDDTVALVASLDLLITASQSALHVAGALGVPCWVLTPSAPDWRLGVGDSRHSIWYGDHLKLYRQKMGEDWGPVIEEVAGDLVDWIRTRKAEAA